MRVAPTGGELKRNDPARYSYTASSISKRTGLTREEIRELRQYGKEEASDSPFKREEGVRGIRNEDIQPKSKPGINLKKGAEQSVRRSSLIESPFSVEANEEGVQKASIDLPGGFGVSYGNDGIGVSGSGFGVEFGEDKSSVELPGGTKITFVNKGCFVITVHHIFNQYAFSNIERKPGCDDDDDNGGSDEPKPPHCIGSDGKPGTGEPKNLLPECLEDTTDLYRFQFFLNDINSGKTIYFNGSVKFDERKGLSKDISLSINHYGDGRNIWKYKSISEGYITYDGNVTQEWNNEGEALASLGSSMTYSEAKAQAEAIYAYIKDQETTPGYVFNRSTWVQVMATDLNGNPVSCNPTGNEGCEDREGSSSNNKKSTSYRPTKPSGGLKSKNKSTEDDEMNCCARLEKKLGLDAFPGELPVSVLQKEDGEVVKIESLSQLLLWLIDSLDERLGKFPVTVKIEDTNPLKEGNQSEEIDFPNIAEFMAETYALGFQNSMSNAIQLNIQTNLLIENGLLKQSLTRVENILNEIIQYYGWQTEERTKKIDIPYTPEKSNYDEFLKPGKLNVKIIDRVDSKDNLELNIILDKLMEAATIIKQTNFRKINPNSDIASQIANYARLGLDVYNTVKGSKDDDKSWEDFKEKIASDEFYPSDEKPLINEVGSDG